MHKLTLDLDGLELQSFEVDEPPVADRGTVQGFAATNHSCPDTYCCPYTRFGTCTC
jgi:hypothetical protein